MKKSLIIQSLVVAVTIITGGRSALGANGTAYYFDIDGTLGGFGSPSGTYAESGNFWRTSSAGTAATAALLAGAQMTFGYSGTTGIDGCTFTINMDGNNWSGLLINSTSANVTLSGTANAYLNADAQTWTVPAGSTLTEAITWSVSDGGSGLNFNGRNVTLSGNGVINFNSNVEYNSAATITQNMTGTVNFKTGWTGTPTHSNDNQANYTLTAGYLNFATAEAAKPGGH